MSELGKSDIAVWLERMGFNKKQVSVAAEQLGINAKLLTRKRDGVDGAEVTLTDRLAMAALRAGIPAWTPETDAYLAHLNELNAVVSETPPRPRKDAA
ncbi:hypothetical protein BO068_004763 [Escherichia coli]|nr:hypothetical protein [Salmonella enterica subsp. enterica serovar Virchow]EBX4816738.1 hypothetical protein [Salmonella enterica subsp. enterica serovar Newport]ECI7685831.1 hypothetical protein [Salmonella enterica subsp. enterica serovar Paratyphi A]EFG2885580.1 hypothetical protein [Escherichia coli]